MENIKAITDSGSLVELEVHSPRSPQEWNTEMEAALNTVRSLVQKSAKVSIVVRLDDGTLLFVGKDNPREVGSWLQSVDDKHLWTKEV